MARSSRTPAKLGTATARTATPMMREVKRFIYVISSSGGRLRLLRLGPARAHRGFVVGGGRHENGYGAACERGRRRRRSGELRSAAVRRVLAGVGAAVLLDDEGVRRLDAVVVDEHRVVAAEAKRVVVAREGDRRAV